MLTAALAALAFAISAPPAAAEIPDGAVHEQAFFHSSDGTRLHADVLRPAGAGRFPVIVYLGPYNSHTQLTRFSRPGDISLTRVGPYFDDPALRAHADDLLSRGYALVIASLRGYGRSEGCGDFGGRGEQADAKATVEWAASRRWSNGRVGMYGISYGGWTQVMALATRPRGLRAVAIQSPSVDFYAPHYDDGVHRQSKFFLGPAAYHSQRLDPPSTADGPDAYRQWASAVEARCFTVGDVENLDPDPTTRWWRERRLIERASRSRVPVLLATGFWDDAGARIGAVMEWWRRLRGRRHAWFGQYAHVHATNVPAVGRDGFFAQALRLFDRELRDVAVAEPEPPVAVQEGPSGRWRAEDAWPPEDAAGWALSLRPGRYLDVPGNKGEAKTPEDGFAEAEPGVLSPFTGEGAWSVTRPLASEAHLAGAPRLELRATGRQEATVVALLYDVAPDRSAVLATRGAALLRSDGTASVSLDEQDWRFAAGHRIALLVTGADDTAYAPVTRTLGEIVVEGGRLKLPLLAMLRTDFIEGGRGRFSAARRPIAVPAAALEDPVELEAP